MKRPSLKNVSNYLSSRAKINIQEDIYQQAYVEALVESVDETQAVFLDAEAGTGKTSIAVSVGYYLLQKDYIDQIVYIRSSVAIRELGFLPGSIEEKEAPYMQAGLDALSRLEPSNPKLCGTLIENEQLKITTTAFLRGVDWHDRKFIIIDEAQNFSLAELQTILTRAHDKSKYIIIGSTKQCDEEVNKIYIKDNMRITPFELYAQHFTKTPEVNVKSIKLVHNYRGNFSLLSDKVGETLEYMKTNGDITSMEEIKVESYFDHDEEDNLWVESAKRE